ncbi:MAG: hypothetical protein ABSD73_04085 [Candidatus Bathyarchaeia archaeon]
MTGATIDHIVAFTVLLGAMLLFVGLFNQTIQTAILYQSHRYLATKCSDLLDGILLNPGSPFDSANTTFWGRTDSTPTIFGLQDPEFTQYELSPFSLMRLNYSLGSPIYYPMTNMYYSNVAVGFGKSLLVPFNEVVNYSTVAGLLGINGTYGFSLTITPIVTVNISPAQTTPLNLTVTVTGNGYPLADANVSYCLVNVTGQAQYPSYNITNGTGVTNSQGQAFLGFPGFDGTQTSYAIVAFARSSGLVGAGDYEHVLYNNNYVVPLIADFGNGSVLLANSADLYGGNNQTAIQYNATFVLLAQDFTLREMPLSNVTGNISPGAYSHVVIPTNNTGILAITYEKNQTDSGIENNSGIVLMPWGVSSMSFPVVFGGNPLGGEWVTTDVRQVTINGISYQAKLALWSQQGYQVVS